MGFRRVLQAKYLDHRNHIVIVGFGLNGRNVAKAARAADIPYVIVEMNTEIVQAARSDGEPIFYGDCCSRCSTPACERQIGARNCSSDIG